MSSTKEERLKITVDVNLDGQPVVKYLTTPNELSLPAERKERIEWVRQSYERFLEKVDNYENIETVKK